MHFADRYTNMTCVFWKKIFQKPKPLLSWETKRTFLKSFKNKQNF